MSNIVPIERSVDLKQEIDHIARDAAGRIAQLQRKMANDIVEIGRELIRVRDVAERGFFLKWLGQIGLTKSTAYNFMAVAERLGDKLPTVGSLPLGTVYRLAAPGTPDNLRNDIVDRLGRGEDVDVDHEIYVAVAEAKRQREVAKRAVGKTPEGKRLAWKNYERRQREAERQRAEIDARRALERESQLAAATIIVRALDDKQFELVCDLLEGLTNINREVLIDAKNDVTPGESP